MFCIPLYPSLHQNILLNDFQSNFESLGWPHKKVLIFSYMQVWRWLWDRKNEIDADDRKPLMQVVKSLVYSKDEKTFESSWKLSKTRSISKKYPNYLG